MPPIRLSSLNIRGLSNPTKQDYVSDLLHSTHCDILLLQETKFSNNSVISNLQRKYGKTHKVYASTPTMNNSAGVLTIFNNKARFVHISTIELIKHHCLISTLMVDNHVWKIVNIYAPTNVPSRITFFDKLNALLPTTHEVLILAGDFNCVENKDRDRESKTPNNYGTGASDSLRTIITSHDLHDLACGEQHAANYTFYGPTSAARLDRFYVPSDSRRHFTDTVRHPCPFSDHWIISTAFSPADPKKRKASYWKLNNQLLHDHQWVQLVENEIAVLLRNCSVPLFQRWDGFKTRVRNLAIQRSIELAHGRRAREAALAAEYVGLAKDFEAGKDTRQQLVSVQHQMRSICEERMKGAAIRARVEWISNQEKPSRRFFSLETEHAKRKTIGPLREDDRLIQNHDEIIDTVTRHYARIYEQATTNPEEYTALAKHMKKLDGPTLSALNTDLTADEISRVIQTLPRNKAPGNDGLTAEFYKLFRVRLLPILMDVFNEIITRRKLPPSQRQGVISLIPKSNIASLLETLDGWRPISLLNTNYKIFTKILTNRLKHTLEECIGSNQKCAIPGRKITDLTQLYSLIYEKSSAVGPPLMMMQLDQKAAFDYVNHGYLFQVLREMGINGPFLHAVQACYYGCTAQVQVNGDLTPEIGLYRGVRQGCPLSMLLYVIQLEPVLQWIMKETRIQGFRIGDHEIKYGAYADDVTLLLTHTDSVRYLLKIWEFFERATGSTLNRQKTKGLWVGDWPKKPANLYHLHWEVDGIKVLGIWIGSREVRKRNWDTMETAIRKQLDHWKGRQLSLYGRCVVWNAYIISRYRYRASAAPIPVHVCRKIDRMAALFLWKKKYEPTRRSALLYPKEEGGLGACSLLWIVEASYLQLCCSALTSPSSPLKLLLDVWLKAPTSGSTSSVCTPGPRNGQPYSLAKRIQQSLLKHRTMVEEDIEPADRTTRNIYVRLILTQLPPPKLVIWHGAGRAQRLHKTIFKLHVLPVIKDLLYHTLNDTLPTGHWLERKGMATHIPDPRCVRCMRIEDSEHIFLSCHTSRQLWRDIAHLDLTPPPQYGSANKDLSQYPAQSPRGAGMCLLSLVARSEQSHLPEHTGLNTTHSTTVVYVSPPLS